MKCSGWSVTLLMSLVFLTCANAQDHRSSKNFDLYILIGQSNMAGRGLLTDSLKNEGNDSLFSFSKNEEWVLARHPLHFDKPGTAAVGPGLSFGLTMVQSNPKKKIGLIPCAVGGTAIESWAPGAEDADTKTHPYDDAVVRIRAAMKYGTIKGVLWHQGESNASPEKSQGYLQKLEELIARVRKVVGDPKLPFIAGDLGDYLKGHELINNQLAQLPKQVPYTAVVSAAGLVNKGDQLHFNAASAEELGRRYAQQLQAIRLLLKKP